VHFRKKKVEEVARVHFEKSQPECERVPIEERLLLPRRKRLRKRLRKRWEEQQQTTGFHLIQRRKRWRTRQQQQVAGFLLVQRRKR
jgi:ABC-type uncharacterized transport system ATPase component